MEINNIINGWFNQVRQELGILPDSIKIEAERRLEICPRCPQRKGDRCGLCNCWLIAKAKSNSKCKIERW